MAVKLKGYAMDVLKRHALGKNLTIYVIDKYWNEVTFRTHPTYDLIAWILRYAADVECIQPLSKSQD
jgi:hypothetical protein